MEPLEKGAHDEACYVLTDDLGTSKFFTDHCHKETYITVIRFKYKFSHQKSKFPTAIHLTPAPVIRNSLFHKVRLINPEPLSYIPEITSSPKISSVII